MAKYPYSIPEIDLFKLTDKIYHNQLKRLFLLEHIQYKHRDFDVEPKLDLTENEIFRIDEVPTAEKDKPIELIEKTYDFNSDYLAPAIKKASKKYYEDFKKAIESKKDYKQEVLLQFILNKEKELKILMTEASVLLFFNDLEVMLNELLDDINSIKNIHFPLQKINLNLSKAQILILFHSLLEKNIIINNTPTELFRLVENYFNYRDDKENKAITNANKSLSEYLPSKKTESPRKEMKKSTTSELEEALENVIEYIHKNFGEN